MNDSISVLQQWIEPEPVTFEPAAPGWYVLATVLGLLLLVLVFLFWRHYRNNQYRRIALKWLEQEEKDLLASQNYARLLYVANMLVKRIIMSRNIQSSIASLQGMEWLNYLNHTCPSVSFSETEEHLMDSIYDVSLVPERQQVITFTAKIKRWIKKHRIKHG